jgi:RHS repeat-associated protein
VDGDGKKVVLNVRFPGQYYDQETGLHYNYYRTYDPATGRYITSDPIGLNGGVNTFGYVGGNPVYWSDQYGLKEWAASLGVNLSVGFSPTFFPTGFVGGGMAIGFTSQGQVFIQFSASGSVGIGAFGGVGLQAGIATNECGISGGLSTSGNLQGDFNFGAGPTVGGTVTLDGDGNLGGFKGIRGGAGFGFQTSVGITTTTVIATPVLF